VPKIGLYYPYISFQNEAWLKSAALYWHKITRICPPHHKAKDTPTVRALRDELDLISETDPDPYVHRLIRPCTELIQSRGASLRQRYGLVQANPGAWPPEFTTLDGVPLRVVFIYASKLAVSVQKHLQAQDLAVVIETGKGNCFFVHEHIANYLLTLLAKEIATGTGFYPLTDVPAPFIAIDEATPALVAQRLLGTGRADRPVAGTRQVEERLVMLAFHTLVVPNIAEVPVKKIIRLRKDHGDELNQFQEWATTAAERASAELRNCKDSASVQLYLNTVCKHELQPHLARLRQAFRDAAVDTLLSSSCIRQVIQAGVIGGAAGWVGDPVSATVGGMALASGSILRSYQVQVRKGIQECPVSYLLRAQEDLQPGSLARRCWVSARSRAIGV
jgi:hypothetical protein